MPLEGAVGVGEEGEVAEGAEDGAGFLVLGALSGLGAGLEGAGGLSAFGGLAGAEGGVSSGVREKPLRAVVVEVEEEGGVEGGGGEGVGGRDTGLTTGARAGRTIHGGEGED